MVTLDAPQVNQVLVPDLPVPLEDLPHGHLTLEHQEHLRSSGISDRVIKMRGYESVAGDHPKLKKFSPPSRVPGLLIPHCAKGKQKYQLRPDNPTANNDGNKKKYIFELGSKRFIDTLHAPPEILGNSDRDIAIVEGIKKGDALASQDIAAGLAILIIDGCSGALTHKQVNLGEPLDSVNLKDRKVFVCLDADMATNPAVWTAASKLQDKLLVAGAVVLFVNVPPGKEGKDGIDDFIAGGGDVRALFRVASLDLPPRPIPKPGRPKNPEVKMDYSGCEFIPAAENEEDEFRLALEALGLEVRYNLRSCCHEFRTLNPDSVPGRSLGKWTMTDDRLDAAVRLSLRKRVVVETPGKDGPRHRRYKIGKAMYEEFLKGGAPEVDPFLGWLRGLPKWDGIERIERILQDAFGCKDTGLNRWASAYLFQGAVKRTLEPGAKLDVMPILVGKQGIGKSMFLRSIVPLTGLFTDVFSFSMSYKKQVEATLGTVIVEVSELAGLRKQEQGACKAYLSMQEDRIRLSYDRRGSQFPRRFVVVGTANDDGTGVLPDDPTGSRRYVVVECLNSNELPDDREARLQWWAEALEKVRAGAEVHLPRELHDQQAEVASLHEHPGVLLMEKFEKFLVTTTIEESSLVDLLEKAFPYLEDNKQALSDWQMTRRASQTLHKNGWTKIRKRVEGKIVRMWRSPKRS